MIVRCLQSICILLFGALPLGAALTPGTLQHLSFQDVDGQSLATDDGHVTIITVVTRDNEAQARAVADLVPDPYMADRTYRYITLVNFQGKLFGPFQGVTRAIIRNRLDAEATRLRPEYQRLNLARDPRADLYVIADFDGSAAKKLGLPVENREIAVFVFDRKGKLIARWNGVPPGNSLPNALAKTR